LAGYALNDEVQRRLNAAGYELEVLRDVLQAQGAVTDIRRRRVRPPS
jgi:hypothetical protein